MEREGDLAGHLISVNTSQHATHKALNRQEIIKSPAHGDRPDIGLHKQRKQSQMEHDLFHQNCFLFIPTEVLRKTSFNANLLAIYMRNKSFRSVLHIKKCSL